jgi:hypothetical protein
VDEQMKKLFKSNNALNQDEIKSERIFLEFISIFIPRKAVQNLASGKIEKSHLNYSNLINFDETVSPSSFREGFAGNKNQFQKSSIEIILNCFNCARKCKFASLMILAKSE